MLMTGRRHQLRVHCLCLGHPIVGDTTYSTPTNEPLYLVRSLTPTEASEVQDVPSSSSINSDRRRDDSERMMLHAYTFKLPLPASYKPSASSSDYFKDKYSQSLARAQAMEWSRCICRSETKQKVDFHSEMVPPSDPTCSDPFASTACADCQSNASSLSAVRLEGSCSHVGNEQLYLIDIQTEDPFVCEGGL